MKFYPLIFLCFLVSCSGGNEKSDPRQTFFDDVRPLVGLLFFVYAIIIVVLPYVLPTFAKKCIVFLKDNLKIQKDSIYNLARTIIYGSILLIFLISNVLENPVIAKAAIWVCLLGSIPYCKELLESIKTDDALLRKSAFAGMTKLLMLIIIIVIVFQLLTLDGFMGISLFPTK